MEHSFPLANDPPYRRDIHWILKNGSGNHFRASEKAQVRNIELPAFWSHGSVPDTKHLLKSQELKDRINA